MLDMRSANDSALTQVDIGELSVRVRQLHPDRVRRRCPTAPDLRNGIFKSMWQVDAHAMRLPRDGIDDRLAATFSYSGHNEPRLSLFHVDLEIDWREDRIVKFVNCRGKDLKYRCARFGIMAVDNAVQHLALFRSRANINHRRGYAFTLVNRPGPVKNAHESQSVEMRFAVKSGIDLEAANSLAESMSGERVELARAAIRAITVDEFLPFDRPLYVHVYFGPTSVISE